MEVPSLESVVPSQSAYSAFCSQLRTLCLDQFPCGMGSWRDSKIVPPKKRGEPAVVKDKDQVEAKFSVTLKEYPYQTEKIEQLEEFVKSPHSPWQLDYSWSDEARDLRETAVKSPWLVDERYVHEAFKTLKIVDKSVSEIDEEVLRFRNLEELTLSANYLQAVQSEHLPKTLKVLELCGNQIDDLKSLCERAPPLIHLGLGHNTLTCTDDYITGDIWPNLLSLDLSHNHLTDLFDLVSRLTSLPKLRNLILLGNPLFLLPGYRGYVVDSLRLLQILDDTRISADEKHNFKGLVKLKDHILEEVKVRLAVDYIKGLPVPEEIKNPADQPEFPLVNRKFYVEFAFPQGSTTGDVMDLAEGETGSTMTSRADGRVLESQMEGTEAGTEPGTERSQTVTERTRATSEAAEEEGGLVLAPLRSAQLPYAEEVETNWAQIVTRDNLTYMRDFLKTGMEIRVMEEKILSYPADQMNQTPDPKKDKKKDKKDDKKGKEEPKKDDKKNKKKNLDIELHHMPPEYTTFASFHIPLEDFLDGEDECEHVFMHGETEAEAKTDTTSEAENAKAKKTTGKKKPASAKKEKKDHPKSPKGKKEEKEKERKGKGVDKASEEEEELPPPPLEVCVKVRLVRMQTAADALKTEDGQ